MKFRIIAYTPVGVFHSNVWDFSEDEKHEIIAHLKREDLNYLKFDLKEGDVIIKSEVVKNSVFIIEIVNEEE